MYERKKKEMYDRIEAARKRGEPLPVEDDETKIRIAESSLLGNLTKAFLDLTEELAGDLDQDLR